MPKSIPGYSAVCRLLIVCLLVCLDQFQYKGTLTHSFVYVYESRFCKTTDNIKLDISLCQSEG